MKKETIIKVATIFVVTMIERIQSRFNDKHLVKQNKALYLNHLDL